MVDYGRNIEVMKGYVAAEILTKGIKNPFMILEPSFQIFVNSTGIIRINKDNVEVLVKIIEKIKKEDGVNIEYLINSSLLDEPINTTLKRPCKYRELSHKWKKITNEFINDGNFPNLCWKIRKVSDKGPNEDINLKYQVRILAREENLKDGYAIDVREGSDYFNPGRHEIIINTTGYIENNYFRLGRGNDGRSPILVRCGEYARSNNTKCLELRLIDDLYDFSQLLFKGEETEYIRKVLEKTNEFVNDLKYLNFEKNSIQ